MGSEKSNGIGGGVMKIKGNEFEIGNLTKPARDLENEIFQTAVTGYGVRHAQ
jgi:hypothetical protein